MTQHSGLYSLLHSGATRWPEQIALEQGELAVTYAELQSRATSFGQFLARVQPLKGHRVGICMPKSPSFIESIFALLQLEACYLPMDFEAPEERNLYIAEDAGLTALILPAEMEWKSDPGPHTLHHYQDRKILFFHRPEVLYSEELAFILYTSGSTGQPKGVTFTQANALSFLNWCSQTFQPPVGSVFSSHAPLHFDLSVLDLYLCLMHGGKLILIDVATGKNPRALSHLIQEKKITHWYSTPTVLKLMVTYGKLERYDHSSLQCVLFAGEVFPPQPLKLLTEAWPQARFYNLYGPTETNVCTYFPIPLPIADSQAKPFPIGKVCPPLEAMILEEEGGSGELCISGPGVTPGYWKQEEKNRTAFFEQYGTTWYRTGDKVSRDAQGNFLYLGRIDRMVKKNGFRVELGEIEHGLQSHPRVVDAASLAVYEEDFSCRLIAVVQTLEGWEDTAELRDWCQKGLPYYMIPDEFAYVEKMPKTSTDKTDYQTLNKLFA
jgi:amino acid adenylation domain-containing protein